MPTTPKPPAADWPAPDALLGAWRRLVADPDGAAEFAEAVLTPLTASLAGRHRRADPDEVSAAAGDAVLAVLKRPAAYDPARLPLAKFLLLVAKRRLFSRFDADRKHHAGRIPWDCVELDAAGRNGGDDDSPGLDVAELAAVVAQFSDGERRVWQLMREGERRTALFADALGIAGDPDAAAVVKRAKDRILARLKRAAGGDDG